MQYDLINDFFNLDLKTLLRELHIDGTWCTGSEDEHLVRGICRNIYGQDVLNWFCFGYA